MATTRTLAFGMRNGLPRLLCLMQLPPPVHGAAVVNQNVARSERLASRFRIDVVPMRFARSIAELHAFSPRKLIRATEVAVRLAGSLLVRRPDAVYFTLSPSGGAFYRDCVYVAIIKIFGVRRIYHLHGKGVARQLDARWRRALYSWAFRGAWVIHLSPTLKGDVSPVVADERMVFVGNGVADHAPSLIRQRSVQGPVRVLFLSNMMESKGPLVLLEALGLLHQRGCAFEATFAGAPSSDGCLAAFENLVGKFDLADRVRYVGPVFDEAKHALFRDHDVFVLPTFNDAFALVLLEAMLWGLPVVSTHEGATPDIVEDGATGFLVAKHDVVALAERMELLFQNPDLRQTMGDLGRARYLELFTLDHFERNLVDALTVCLES